MKKLYTKPAIITHSFKPQAILAGSGEEAPESGGSGTPGQDSQSKQSTWGLNDDWK